MEKNFGIYNNNKGELELFDTGTPQEIDGVLQRTEKKRLAVRSVLDDENQGKDNQFDRKNVVRLQKTVLYYVKTEQALVKRALQQNQADEAAGAVQYLFLLAQKLCAVRQYDLRLTAARIRLQTVPLLQETLLNRNSKKEHIQTFDDIFRKKLDAWTKDSEIWEEYRTEGLNVYKVLTEAEQNKNVFEKAMKPLIDCCSLPYYRRVALLKQLKEELRNRTDEQPATDLLKVIPDAMELLALERTQCEMVHLGLSAALTGSWQQHARTPFSGEEYNVLLTHGGIMITYPGNVKAFYVQYRD
ncbi:hypothetical protein FACS189419_01830 [Planctomycetales bacterium]|nr:hypothetical protein FACS189419_01830 [Planctomycetales bacterium]